MIEISDLTTEYDYGEPFEVKKAGFKKGQISSVIGRNGSGKSTLLKAIAGLKSYRGSILIDGRESRDYSPMDRARSLAFLPQSVRSLSIDVQTLVEHGRFPYHGSFRKMTRDDRAKVREALELTDMEKNSHRELRELSGGERQRAYLAMVIAQDSPMILMDEPTTYMDFIYQEEFYTLLRQLTERGKGVVMVCHDIEQSFAYSDRVFLMENRKLVFDGSPFELAEREDLVKRNFGVYMKEVKDPEALYPFGMKR